MQWDLHFDVSIAGRSRIDVSTTGRSWKIVAMVTAVGRIDAWFGILHTLIAEDSQHALFLYGFSMVSLGMVAIVNLNLKLHRTRLTGEKMTPRGKAWL
jgi:hypothetical protein